MVAPAPYVSPHRFSPKVPLTAPVSPVRPHRNSFLAPVLRLEVRLNPQLPLKLFPLPAPVPLLRRHRTACFPPFAPPWGKTRTVGSRVPRFTMQMYDEAPLALNGLERGSPRQGKKGSLRAQKPHTPRNNRANALRGRRARGELNP